MSTIAIERATLSDLAKTEGKAELIDGRIVHLLATGHRPSRVAGRVFRSLDDYADATGGFAYTDNVGYAVPELASGRESFSPDASYHTGPAPKSAMDFIDGAPAFAAEVRSKNDYGPAAEIDLAAKRADYFEAGTRIVWDVDPVANVIRSYSIQSPDQPLIFVPGGRAHAEPAVPGWTIDLDRLFRA